MSNPPASASRDPMSVVPRLVVFALATHGLVVTAFSADPGRQDGSRQKVYLLGCPTDESFWKLPRQGLYWKTLHKMLDEKAGQLTKVATRDEVDQSLYVDIEGLRLYVSSRECLKSFKQLPVESSEQITSGYLTHWCSHLW